MCEFIRIYAILLVCTLLTGCSQGNQSSPIETTTPGTLSAQGEFSYSFTLPEAYSLSSESNTEASILRGSEKIGSIVRTDLDVGCIEEKECLHILQYLETFAPPPLIMEYIMMTFDHKAYVSVSITDPETEIRTDLSHHLFEKESSCFDVWFDLSKITDEEKDALLHSVGFQ